MMTGPIRVEHRVRRAFLKKKISTFFVIVCKLFFGFYFDPGSPPSNFRNFSINIFRKIAGPAAGSRHRAWQPAAGTGPG